MLITTNETASLDIESDRVNAAFRMAMMGKLHPGTKNAVAKARLELAASIIAFDDAFDAAQQSSENRTPQILKATHDYDKALRNFGEALMALLRGEDYTPDH